MICTHASVCSALGPLPPGMRILDEAEVELLRLVVRRGAYVTALVVWLEKDGFVHPILVGWLTRRTGGGEIVRRLEAAAGTFEEAIRLGVAKRLEDYSLNTP